MAEAHVALGKVEAAERIIGCSPGRDRLGQHVMQAQAADDLGQRPAEHVGEGRIGEDELAAGIERVEADRGGSQKGTCPLVE